MPPKSEAVKRIAKEAGAEVLQEFGLGEQKNADSAVRKPAQSKVNADKEAIDRQEPVSPYTRQGENPDTKNPSREMKRARRRARAIEQKGGGVDLGGATQKAETPPGETLPSNEQGPDEKDDPVSTEKPKDDVAVKPDSLDLKGTTDLADLEKDVDTGRASKYEAPEIKTPDRVPQPRREVKSLESRIDQLRAEIETARRDYIKKEYEGSSARKTFRKFFNFKKLFSGGAASGAKAEKLTQDMTKLKSDVDTGMSLGNQKVTDEKRIAKLESKLENLQSMGGTREAYAIKENDGGSTEFANLDSETLWFRAQYENKLIDLQNVELERIRQSKLGGDDLKAEMAALVRTYDFEEAEALDEIRRQTRLETASKSMTDALYRVWERFSKNYAGLSFKQKIAISAGLGVTAMALGSSGGAAALLGGAAYWGKRALAGASSAIAAEAAVEKVAQVRRRKKSEKGADAILNAATHKTLLQSLDGKSPKVSDVEGIMKRDGIDFSDYKGLKALFKERGTYINAEELEKYVKKHKLKPGLEAVEAYIKDRDPLKELEKYLKEEIAFKSSDKFEKRKIGRIFRKSGALFVGGALGGFSGTIMEKWGSLFPAAEARESLADGGEAGGGPEAPREPHVDGPGAPTQEIVGGGPSGPDTGGQLENSSKPASGGYLDYLGERSIGEGDTLWKLTTHFGEQSFNLQGADSIRFAKLVEDRINLNLGKLDAATAEAAGFFQGPDGQFSAGQIRAGATLELGVVISEEELNALAQEAKGGPAAPVPEAGVSIERPSSGPTELSESAAPERGVDGVVTVDAANGETTVESQAPRSIEAAAKDLLGTKEDVPRYLESLSQEDKVKVFKDFRIYTAEIFQTMALLESPSSNHDIALHPELSREHVLGTLASQDGLRGTTPLHSSQVEALKDFVKGSVKAFGKELGIPGKTETIQDYVVRMAALARREGRRIGNFHVIE